MSTGVDPIGGKSDSIKSPEEKGQTTIQLTCSLPTTESLIDMHWIQSKEIFTAELIKNNPDIDHKEIPQLYDQYVRERTEVYKKNIEEVASDLETITENTFSDDESSKS